LRPFKIIPVNLHQIIRISLKSRIYIVYIFLICFYFPCFSQERPADVFPKDTINFNQGGAERDKGVDPFLQADTSIVIPISTQSIDQEIEHGAQDTQWIDVVNNQIHLIGDAYVKYQENEIKAGYIIFDFIKKEAFAQSLKREDGQEVGRPSFKAQGQNFEYNKMKFNFETQKGIVYEAYTQQGEYFVHGAVTKFVSQAKDSLYVDDVIFNKNALITTCNLPHPHYGIRASKLKLIPDKLAVIGPSRLEIGGIPTPLFIPFAFMPMIQGQRSGIIFGGQQGFEFSDQLGFGFREIGYYWALNDYMDLRVTGDIYSRGSWGLRVASNYAKRYKFRGNLQLGFSKQIIETQGDLTNRVNKSFSFGLTHNQDSKAHPYLTVGGNFRFTTNDFDRNNFNDAASQLENIINSNFRISHSLPGINALSLNATIAHSQNTRTRRIDFTLPNLELRMKTIYPFKRRNGTGKEKWFEKVNVRYNSKFKNFVSTLDTILFRPETLEKIQTGVSHDVSVGASFNILNHFQLTPSMDYDELWFAKTLSKQFNPDTIVTTDIFTGRVDSTFTVIEDIFNTGFSTYRNFNSAVNLSTNIFGTALFKKGWLRGIRHTMRPSIGLSFSPSTERYIETVRDDIDDEDSFREYTRFDGGIFSVPRPGERRMALTYSIQNLFEGKYYSKKDSTEKKFKILNALNISGSRNFALDSLNWSTVSMSGNAKLFKKSNLVLAATFDPYLEENNRRVNKSVWSESKRPFRFEDFRATLSTSFSVKDIIGYFDKRSQKKSVEEQEKDQEENQFEQGIFNDEYGDDFTDRSLGSADRDLRDQVNRRPGQTQLDKEGRQQVSFWEMLSKFRVSHVITYRLTAEDGIKEGNFQTHSIRVNGNIELTDNWYLTLGQISYDFTNKRFVYPSIGLARDLHCWNMRFDWQPARGTFNFLIAVKSPQIGGFLKYNYGRNQFDSLF